MKEWEQFKDVAEELTDASGQSKTKAKDQQP